MTFGSTNGAPWTETLATERGAQFSGRTFCRLHTLGDRKSVPVIGEIWAAFGHRVEAHAHDADELMYVLRGSIEVNGRTLRANDVVFIPRGEAYHAAVVSPEGSHVLRIEFANPDRSEHESEYDAKTWAGPLTELGFPDLGMASDAG
jgi:quercetin dioxygenase-like cupin family protein